MRLKHTDRFSDLDGETKRKGTHRRPLATACWGAKRPALGRWVAVIANLDSGG
jgi:hypothetical protein